MMCDVAFDLPGLREGRRRGDILVLVDVLSFSTAVAAGCARGVVFLPAGSHRRAAALALEAGATASCSRLEGGPGRYSLSPGSYAEAPAGLRVVLRSPNGARMAVHSRGAPAVLVAGLVNASAAGDAAGAAARTSRTGVTVVACGERERRGGRRRFAAEDLLGAGAVAAAVDLPRTGEAEVAVRAFAAARPDLVSVLMTTRSGVELVGAGFEDDVAFAARHDALHCIPLLHGSEIRSR